MNKILRGILVAGLVGGVGCGRQATKPAARPVEAVSTPATDPGFAGAAPSPVATRPPNAATEEVSAPQTINMDADDADNRATRAEVLKRIDVMPNLRDDEKDKLYVQVERARAMGKVITIPFASGEKSVSSASAASLARAVGLPQIKKYSEDPTVVFVVLGYADKKGDPKSNQAISLQRAEAVVKALKEKSGVMNVVQAVGMGGSELFDSSALDKNRVVEVWAVLP